MVNETLVNNLNMTMKIITRLFLYQKRKLLKFIKNLAGIASRITRCHADLMPIGHTDVCRIRELRSCQLVVYFVTRYLVGTILQGVPVEKTWRLTIGLSSYGIVLNCF